MLAPRAACSVAAVPQHLTLLGDKLPRDVQVRSYRAEEAISRPYAVDIEISTADLSFQSDDCLQHRLLLEVQDPAGNLRHYDGLPDRVGFTAYDGRELFFRLRLRPALAALEHR